MISTIYLHNQRMSQYCAASNRSLRNDQKICYSRDLSKLRMRKFISPHVHTFLLAVSDTADGHRCP